MAAPRGYELYEPEKKKFCLATKVLLLAVVIGSPAGLAMVTIFAASRIGVFSYMFLVFALSLVYAALLYLGRDAPPREGLNMPRKVRAVLFLAFVVALLVITALLISGESDNWDDSDEMMNDVVEVMFLFVLPLQGLLVLGLTGLSATFRGDRNALTVDLILSAVLAVNPFLNFLLVIGGGMT